jgi:hypothetical protein
MGSAAGSMKARMKRKAQSRPEPGTLRDLQSVMWRAMLQIEAHLDNTGKKDTARLTRLVHALSQAASAYMKAIETGELEARLSELEKRADGV